MNRLRAAADAGTLPGRTRAAGPGRYQTAIEHPGDLALALMNIAGERFKFEILPD